jgi:hypothetical protein
MSRELKLLHIYSPHTGLIYHRRTSFFVCILNAGQLYILYYFHIALYQWRFVKSVLSRRLFMLKLKRDYFHVKSLYSSVIKFSTKT